MKNIDLEFLEELAEDPKYAAGVEKFYQWLEVYKTKVKNSTPGTADITVKMDFYDLPFEMQQGIFMRFVVETKTVRQVFHTWSVYEFKDYLKECALPYLTEELNRPKPEANPIGKEVQHG